MPRIPAFWPALWRAAAALLVAGAALVAAPLSAQARTLPVNCDFAAGALAGFGFPQTPPPGADNFRCKPSSAHPDPVILVNGTFANQDDNWQAASPLLANHGYCVFTFNYGGSSASAVVQGTGDIAASAGQLASFDPAHPVRVLCLVVLPITGPGRPGIFLLLAGLGRPLD